MRRVVLLALSLTVAWSVASPAPAPARPEGRNAGTQTVHRVDMGGNRFLPRKLDIAVGDAVEFVNGSGGPHNVAFWPDSLPAGARDPLSRALPDTIGPLIGPLLFEPDMSWTVTFEGVPPGRYPYYCLPHVVGGMVGELVVVERSSTLGLGARD